MQGGADRRRMIEARLSETEARAVADLALIRQATREYLTRVKGYLDEDIEAAAAFEITVDGASVSVSVDYILKRRGRRFAVIKCSPGALESRDRHLISFARVVDSYQIPFAVVTDGSQARILDVISGRLVAEGLASIPSATEADEIVGSMKFVPYPMERMVREKRILLAFDAIKCTEESCD